MGIGQRIQGSVLCLSVVCFFFGETPLYGLPDYLLRFVQDPFSRPELRGQCSTCHINPMGTGPRNAFGEAFEKNKHLVTPRFRQAWPSHFLPSVSTDPLAVEGGEMKATFLANEQETILEIGGERFRLRAKEGKLEKIELEEAARLIAAPPPPPAPPGEPKLPLRNQATFDHYLVNLPTTLPYERGRLSLRFTHRFTQPVLGCDACAPVGDLWGFDSFSYSSLGGQLGITRRLAALVYRSPFQQTLEMGGVFQLLRQEDSEPLAAAVRFSVEGQNNFRDRYTGNLVFPVSRSVSSRAEVFVVPMVSFNANPTPKAPSEFTPPGETRRHLGAVGLGTSLRFRPRSAVVAEWMPRVAGYRGRDSRNTYSFGILRSTNAHVFELVLTNSFATTTSGAVRTGLPEFSLGFNIYRRLR